jgi:hypothetical protein
LKVALQIGTSEPPLHASIPDRPIDNGRQNHDSISATNNKPPTSCLANLPSYFSPHERMHTAPQFEAAAQDCMMIVPCDAKGNASGISHRRLQDSH